MVKKKEENKKVRKKIIPEKKLSIEEIADALLVERFYVAAVFIKNNIKLTERITLTEYKKLLG